MIWTREPPKEPGFYWFKPGERERDLIVEVVNVGGEMLFTPGVWHYPGISVDIVDGLALWAGPVPLPSPADDHLNTRPEVWYTYDNTPVLVQGDDAK